MIAKDICYVCGVMPVFASDRCIKCQPVNRSQKEPVPQKVKPQTERLLLPPKKGKGRRSDPVYEGIQVGD